MNSEREDLYNGATAAAWGYLLIRLNFDLGNVNVLPDFAGYLLLLSAIGRWREERRDLELLRPLGVLLAAWSGVEWVLAWTGRSLATSVPFLPLLVSVASLYFHFQFLTDCAALAAKYQGPEGELSKRLLDLRELQTVCVTGVTLAGYCIAYTGFQKQSDLQFMLSALSLIMLLILAAVGIALLFAMFSLRKLFREPEPSGPA